MKKLTYPAVLKALKAVVAERPDFVYKRTANGCVYRTSSGKPSCLVGQALHRLDVPLPSYRCRTNNEGVHQLRHYLRDRHGVELDDRAGTLLAIVQDRQDNGCPWREALLDAVSVVASRYDR